MAPSQSSPIRCLGDGAHRSAANIKPRTAMDFTKLPGAADESRTTADECKRWTRNLKSLQPGRDSLRRPDRFTGPLRRGALRHVEPARKGSDAGDRARRRPEPPGDTQGRADRRNPPARSRAAPRQLAGIARRHWAHRRRRRVTGGREGRVGSAAVNLLLDTPIWLWSALEPARLSARVRRALDNPQHELWLSP